MDYYIVLGIARSASVVEIKKAYRRLARRFHPDVNPGDDGASVRFREIAEAYNVLVDPGMKQRYDEVGYEPPATGAQVTGFEGFDFTAAVHANQQSTFGDLFAEVLRGEAARPFTPVRGTDLHAVLPLTFEQAASGGEFRLPLVREVTCSDCAGTGLVSVFAGRCPVCDGSGAERSARGHMLFTRACRRCHGAGTLSQQRCPGCAGRGTLTRSERVAVPLPAGVHDAARIRVGSRGHAGRFGGPGGDLYVTIHVAPHPQFRRDGDDVHVVVPVAIHEAALGARIDVPAIAGTTRLRVPPGTQSGQKFRLKERGIPSFRSGIRGDLVVEVRLMLPRVLDERSKALLREFGAINGESVRTSGKDASESGDDRAVRA
jgi:molecular chaperone DnaJ